MTIGFYGGKFLPMHKGHLRCIEQASRECDKVVVIMFTHGNDEDRIRATDKSPELNVFARIEQLERVQKQFPNVECHAIDVSDCRNPDGTENWDMETPLVREVLPHIDYVYSSEPSYDEYFKKAYPEATHRIIDVDRDECPISATMIRAMKDRKEKEQWMV